MAQLSKTAAQIDAVINAKTNAEAGTGPASLQSAPAPYVGAPAGLKVQMTNGSQAVTPADEFAGFDLVAFFTAAGTAFLNATFYPVAGGAYLTHTIVKTTGEAAGRLSYPWSGPTGVYALYQNPGSVATGQSSQAWGSRTTASGDQSTASGSNTVAAGANSLAGGNSSRAYGKHAVALGQATRAVGEGSVATGSGGHAPMDWSRAHGGPGTYTEGNYPTQFTYNQQTLDVELSVGLSNGNAGAMVSSQNGGAPDSARYFVIPPRGMGRAQGQLLMLNPTSGLVQTGTFSFAYKRAATGGVTVSNATVTWDGGVTPEMALAITAATDRVNFAVTPFVNDSTMRHLFATCRALQFLVRPSDPA